MEVPPGDLPGMRILVVEDTGIVAAEIARVLNLFGCDVCGPFSTYETALEAARTLPNLDAALLDVNLMGVPVFPVAQALRDRNIPFAFLTGYCREVLPPDLAAADVLEKPFSKRELEETTRRLLARPAHP